MSDCRCAGDNTNGHSEYCPVVIHYEDGEATVTSNIKYIDYNVSEVSPGDTARYNVANDPNELANLERVGC